MPNHGESSKEEGIEEMLLSNHVTWKNCFVPGCKSTTTTTPTKVFVNVPRDAAKRQRWCAAVESPGKPAKKSKYCCEDHFDLENDMENYWEWRKRGGLKKMKDAALPRRTIESGYESCGSNAAQAVILRSTCPDLTRSCNDTHVASARRSLNFGKNSHDSPLDQATDSFSGHAGYNLSLVDMTNTPSCECSIDNSSNLSIIDPEKTAGSLDDSSQSVSSLDATVINLSTKKDQSTQYDVTVGQIELEHKHVQTKFKVYTKSTQTYFKGPRKVERGIQCEIGPSLSKSVENVTESVVKLRVAGDDLNETVDSISSQILDESSSYHPSNDKTSSASYEKKLKIQLIKSDVYEKFTRIMIEEDPSVFIGLRKDSMYVISLLQEVSAIAFRDIYLVLKKIKTNIPFSILAYEFSMSESRAAKVFKKNVEVMATFFNQLIIWPKEDDIRANLPIPFRYRYSNVQSVIDSLEVEIEKPSNAIHQALTWSNYKKCNTAKYLISITPDGLINFISESAGGRSTDMSIVENCGFLEVLPEGCCVFADRGFKQLDVLLQKKKCTLVRPPSVRQDVKSTKAEVKLTKQVASIRIHVERTINRIRNFRMLDIHTRVDNNLVQHLDSIIVIVCGLVNLQSPIIKQT